MHVQLTWADGNVTQLETWQIDELAAEDAGWPGPATFREDPDDEQPDGIRRVALNDDGSEYTARQMLRHLRAAAKAALSRTGDPRADQFDALVLEVMPGEQPDPTGPAAPAT